MLKNSSRPAAEESKYAAVGRVLRMQFSPFSQYISTIKPSFLIVPLFPMNIVRYAKTIFAIAAALNIVGALSALVAMQFHLQLFYGHGSTDILVKFYHYNFWCVVLAMGMGYAIIARNPEQNQGLIFIGGIGKLIAAASWLLMYSLGEALPLVLAGIAYDGSFGLLFLVILWQSPSRQTW